MFSSFELHKNMTASTIFVFVLTFSLTCILRFLMNRRTEGRGRRAPCLPTLPIIGSFPFLPKTMGGLPNFCMETAKRLGPVFAFYTGNKYTVVLNGLGAITAAFVRHSTDFAGRDPFYVEQHFTNRENRGLILKQYTSDYKRNHKISLSILKEFGFGSKQLMQQRIMVEVETLIKAMKKINGKNFNPLRLVTASVSNVVLSILFGTRYDYENLTLYRMNKAVRSINKNVLPLLSFFPVLRFLPHNKRKLAKFIKGHNKSVDLLNSEIDKSLDNRTQESFVKSYVEKEGKCCDREELLYITRDLTIGGTGTTTTTLLWGLTMLANHHQVQEVLHKEIDSVVSKDRLPSIEDLPNLPYVEAAIHELMRWKTLVPFGDPHLTIQNTDVNGVFIPCGTNIWANIYSVHMDPEMWPDPEQYKPERFLDSNGKMFGGERIIPFSLGKRSCTGQVLARQELFLFFAGLVQQFDVLPPEGRNSVDVDDDWDIILAPTPFEVRLKPRY